MNSNTALVMFAMMAAFGLATVVIPILNEAHAAAPCYRSSCQFDHPTGQRFTHPGPPV